jgi:hypothetical protein
VGGGDLPWPTIITNSTKITVDCEALSRLGFRVSLVAHDVNTVTLVLIFSILKFARSAVFLRFRTVSEAERECSSKSEEQRNEDFCLEAGIHNILIGYMIAG